VSYWDNVTPNSVANASDGFSEFRVGDNEAYVKHVIEKESESGNQMLQITFANDEGAEIRHYIVDGEYKLSKLKQFYLACGIPLGNTNLQSWIGKRCIVVCKPGKPYNDKVYNQVSYLRPLDAKNHTSTGRYPPGSSEPKNHPNNQPANNSGTAQQPSDDGFTDDIPF